MNHDLSFGLLLCLTVLLISCEQRRHNYLPEMQVLSEKSGIEMVVIDEAQKITNTPPIRFVRNILLTKYIDDPIKSAIQQDPPKSKTVELPGISFIVEAKNTTNIVDKINNKLSYRNYIAFVSDDGLGKDKAIISIIQTSDKYDLLRMQKISGGSDIYSTDSLITKLNQLDKKYPFDFIGVGSDWCLLRFKANVTDYANLAKEINKVCPLEPEMDGTVESYAKRLKESFEKKSREVPMWWD